MKKASSLNEEVLGFEIATFLATAPEALEAFLTATGSCLQDFKDSLGSPGTQAALMDFLLEQESLLLDFCAQAPWRPEDIWHVRRRLPGMATWDSV